MRLKEDIHYALDMHVVPKRRFNAPDFQHLAFLAVGRAIALAPGCVGMGQTPP
jgi:hypothetical protein